jgi:hypothetical protein
MAGRVRARTSFVGHVAIVADMLAPPDVKVLLG